MTHLWGVLASLLQWQKENRGHTDKRCLEAVREACAEHGMALPVSNHDYKGKLAIDCGKTLDMTPHEWGWSRVSKLPDSGDPVLVFFDRCGVLDDGRVAGHIAIYKPSTGAIVANRTYHMNAYWRKRVRFIFQRKA